MSKERAKAPIAERALYLVTVIVTPSIPLFFLYSQNAAQGLLFRHFLILAGVLGAISLIIYLPISRFLLRRRRTMILLAIFWTFFWFYSTFESLITRGNANFSQERVVVYLLVIIVFFGFVLRWISINRYVANIIALVLCLLFVFNFAPEALAVYASERQRAENRSSGEMPYEIKKEFYIDPSLPSPNVYWLHMDGMMGFSAIEYFFRDSQTELKNELIARGFLINESAQLEAGYTRAAIPAVTSPTFYDSYLVYEFARVANLTRDYRENAIHSATTEKGFSLDDIYPYNELIAAFSIAGYMIITNQQLVLQSKNVDMMVNGWIETSNIRLTRETNILFSKLQDFIDLIVDASVLFVIKPIIEEFVEGKKSEENTQLIPDYQETVNEYITGYSDSDNNMGDKVRAMEHATTFQSPFFFFFDNSRAHFNYVGDHDIGGITYEEYIGHTFFYDECGNVYKERLDDPNSIHLYLPQHKYTIKQMIAQIDTIIKNDPEAIIVIQADHGIHGIGPGADTFDSMFMFERGYSLEDQLYFHFSTISAVRVPPQYGTLTQPLDPLDITRWLVNNFVGGGNYEYLYYKEN